MTRKNKKFFFNPKKYIFNSNVFPFVLAFTVLGVLFVLVRMKGVEQDYAFNKIQKEINDIRNDNKELKAERAKLLSTKNLSLYSKKFELVEPDEKQILVIP